MPKFPRYRMGSKLKPRRMSKNGSVYEIIPEGTMREDYKTARAKAKRLEQEADAKGDVFNTAYWMGVEHTIAATQVGALHE